MSMNIRGFTFDDKLKKSFYYRSPLLMKVIKEAEPDIIGFQEMGPFEYDFFSSHMSGYTFIQGYATEGGGGVVTAIRSDRFEIVDTGKFWLSETPDVESGSWDTACLRVALYANIIDKKTNSSYIITNTHLDHVSEEARIKGMALILNRMEALDASKMIIFGDINDFVFGEMYESVMDYGLNDAQLVASKTYLGPGATYHSYGRILNNARIDFFFLTPNITVNSYRVIDTTFDGVYYSDHFSILMKIAE